MVTVEQQRVRPATEVGAYRLIRDGKEIYQFGMRWSALSDFIPSSPHATPSKAQRPYRESHAKAIKRYFIEAANRRGRMGWVSGPLVLAIPGDALTFEPSAEVLDPDVPVFGKLTLPEGARDSLTILDGQHRRAAMSMIRVDAQQRIKKAMVANTSLRDSHMSIELYATSDIKEMRQMFADFSRQRPIDSPTRVWFDGRDFYHEAAQILIEQKAHWLQAYIPIPDPSLADIPPSTIASNTPWWMTLTNLSQTIRARTSTTKQGVRRTIQADQPSDAADMGKRYFEEELPRLCCLFADFRGGEGSVDRYQLPDLRRSSTMYRAQVPKALAWMLREWTVARNRPIEELAAYLANADTRPDSEANIWRGEDGRYKFTIAHMRQLLYNATPQS